MPMQVRIVRIPCGEWQNVHVALDEQNRVLWADCLSHVGVPDRFDDLNDILSRASDVWFIDNLGEQQHGRRHR